MSIYIIAFIIVLVVVLIGYAIISRTVEKRRVQRQRLLTTLKVRQRNFRHMITGFPPHFLDNDLTALVYRALIDTCEQLSKLETNDPKHQEDLKLYSHQLTELKHSDQVKRIRLENPNQIKEVRQHLQELYRFVGQQEALKAISKIQASTFADQIKRLALMSSVDGYIFQAKQAQQTGKLRLAIHYYGLARKLLTPENVNHIYDKQIAQLSSAISKLEERSADMAPDTGESADHPHNEASTQPTPSTNPKNKEWDNFVNDDEKWKKKQLYD